MSHITRQQVIERAEQTIRFCWRARIEIRLKILVENGGRAENYRLLIPEEQWANGGMTGIGRTTIETKYGKVEIEPHDGPYDLCAAVGVLEAAATAMVADVEGSE